MSKMTRAGLLREAARVLDMIEDTSLVLAECVKLDGKLLHRQSIFSFSDTSIDYEFALALIGNQPVFKGSVLYFNKTGMATQVGYHNYPLTDEHYSWYPPKPKTVMVELLREDAEAIASLNAEGFSQAQRVEDACRKALSERR